MSRIHLALVGTLIASTLAGVCQADTGTPDVRTQRIDYSDLNLADTRAADVLYQRIRSAAENVCEVRGTRSLAAAAQYRTCVRHAVEHAVAAVDVPLLTQHHDKLAHASIVAPPQARLNR